MSLAALGLGFQQRHFSLFALAAVTGAAFWYMDGLMKGYQYRYYVRMREIEYTAYLVNSVPLGGIYGDLRISAPRIDMTWPFMGYAGEPEPADDARAQVMEGEHPDWRADAPWRRTPQEINAFLRRRFFLPNVWLPHAVAVVLGVMLFTAAAALDASGAEHLHLLNEIPKNLFLSRSATGSGARMPAQPVPAGFPGRIDRGIQPPDTRGHGLG